MATSVLVFGSGDCGQLGIGEDVDVLKKPKVHPFFEGKNIVAVAAGGLHTLALSAEGRVYSWGCNDEKALGHEQPEFSVGLVEGIAGKVVKIAAGDSISAALTSEGQVYSWGTFRDSKGVMGHSLTGDLIQNRPTIIKALARIVDVSAGANHLMALSEDGQLFSWGCGEQGQLGRRILERHKMLGLRPSNVTPRFGRSRAPIKSVKCGSYHTLIVTENGHLLSMGLNNYGQLGRGDFEERVTAEVVEGVGWQGAPIDAAAGEHHSLVLTQNGIVYAFGRGDSGQLGLPSIKPTGEKVAQPLATVIPFPAAISMISSGGNHNIAYSSQSRQLFTWGYGGMHQLGHGPDSDEWTPKELPVKKNVLQVSAGGQHSVILVS